MIVRIIVRMISFVNGMVLVKVLFRFRLKIW